MIDQGFYVRKELPSPWWVMAFYNIETNADYEKIYGTLLASGIGVEKANAAVSVLKNPNTGYILTNSARQTSIIAISHATSYDEMFDTVTHEMQHLTADICAWFKFPYYGEKAAYIQGEIGKNMYKAVALSVCPKCNCQRRY